MDKPVSTRFFDAGCGEGAVCGIGDVCWRGAFGSMVLVYNWQFKKSLGLYCRSFFLLVVRVETRFRVVSNA